MRTPTTAVQTFKQIKKKSLAQLLQRYGLMLEITMSANIPGSYWGDTEAGLIDNKVVIRDDTPIHSILHEACHYICMNAKRRKQLHTDAGGDYAEENGVCYLQILLAEEIEGCSRARMWQDMDSWGYTFRLGSAQAWFEQDAEDARQWLRLHRLIDYNDQPTFSLRQ